MEINLKENFKIKALVIILIASLLFVGTSFFTTVKATDVIEEEQTEALNQEEEQAEEPEIVEIKLNRKVRFTGEVHKTWNEGSKVKKTYKDGEIGEGVIAIIKKNKAYGIYILGEGWVAEEQILGSKKFIEITLPDYNDLKDGSIKSSLKINGEFTDVLIDNNAVVTFENGELKVHGDGDANVKLIKKDGEEVNFITSHYDGELHIVAEEKYIGASIENFSSDTTILNKAKVNITGNGAVGLMENLSVGAKADGTATLKTMDDKELLAVNADGMITATPGGEEGLVVVDANSNQGLSVLAGKIKAALNERAKLTVGKEKVEGTVGAGAKVNDYEIADGDAKIEYTYGDEDPIGGVTGRVLGKPFNKEGVRIPLISGIKALIGKI